MGLIRYILIGVLIYLAGMLVRRLLRGFMQTADDSGKTGGDDTGVETVRCAHCGLFLPKTQAVLSEQDYYCSKAHSQAGPGNT